MATNVTITTPAATTVQMSQNKTFATLSFSPAGTNTLQDLQSVTGIDKITIQIY